MERPDELAARSRRCSNRISLGKRLSSLLASRAGKQTQAKAESSSARRRARTKQIYAYKERRAARAAYKRCAAPLAHSGQKGEKEICIGHKINTCAADVRPAQAGTMNNNHVVVGPPTSTPIVLAARSAAPAYFHAHLRRAGRPIDCHLGHIRNN